MSLPQIVCENCGAKYRLPDSFQGTQAKCKACGNVIDVAAQRAAAAAPSTADTEAAAPRPAKARPAKERPARERPARAERSRPAGGRRGRRGEETAEAEEPKAGRAGRRGAAAGGRRGRRGEEAAEGGDEGGGRRGRAARGEKKDNKAVLIGSGIGIVAVLVVVVIFLMGGNGDEEPGTTQTAENQAQGDAEKAGGAAASEDADAEKDAGAKPVEGALKPTDEPPSQPDAQPDARPDEPEAPAREPAAEKPDLDPDAPRWMHSEVTSVDQVFVPKDELAPVEWPDYVTDEDKAKIIELLDEVQHGGAGAPAAKVALEEMGHKALAGIINRLREVNYLDSWESMYAWELNKLLEAMTIGMNVGFVAIEIGEDIDPRKADWNAKTAKAWHKLLDLYPTPEKFADLLKARRTRHNK